MQKDVLFLFCIHPVHAADNKDKQDSGGLKTVTIELSDHAAFIIKGQKVTLGEAIRIVLDRNRDTLIGAYEVAMSDSNYLKFKGRYSPVLNMEGGGGYQEFPLASVPLYGRDQRTWDASTALSKMFSSGRCAT